MKNIYEVCLVRTVTHTATVSLEASSKEEAENLAKLAMEKYIWYPSKSLTIHAKPANG